MARVTRPFRTGVAIRELGALAFLTALCVAISLRSPEFFSWDNLKDVLVQISPTAICAVGMTFVIVTAGIDLSVGSVLALSGSCGAVAGLAYGSPAVGILVTLAVGAVCGASNGFLVTTFRLPPFIATLGIMSVARGLAFVVTESSPVEVLEGMRAVARARFLGQPFPIFLLIAVYAIGILLLRFSVLGRHTYAVGGNETAARLSGIRTNRTKLAVYTLCGLLSGVSALIVAGRLAWMQPQEGEAFELDVIAAVVIGGTSLYGGQGSLFGTLIGALIMGVVRNGLNLMAMEYNAQKIIIGAIVIFAVSADVLVRRFVRR